MTGGRPETDTAEASARWRWEVRFAILLAVIAGLVDVIGFQALGNVLAAHITGNLVMISASIFRDLSPAQLLALPVFAVAVAGTWLLAKLSGAPPGRPLARFLMTVQFLLLFAVLVYCVGTEASTVPHSWTAGVAASLAVSAMACQHALLRLAAPRAPSTAVMTGNLTNAVISFLDVLAHKAPLTVGAAERLRNSLLLLLGFILGCVGGALATHFLDDWAWSLPAALAAIGVALR